MVFSEQERLSGLFAKLREHCEARIADAHQKLEAPTCSQQSADVMRGRILELRYLMQLGDQDPTITPYIPD